MAPAPARRSLAVAVAAVLVMAAGCGGGHRPAGISGQFQRQAVDACSRAVGAIGVLDFTSLPGPRALTRIARALRDSASRVRAAPAPGRADREVRARLAGGLDKAASAVDGYVSAVRASAPDEERYAGMVTAIGDMGSEGQRAGTDACVVPTQA